MNSNIRTTFNHRPLRECGHNIQHLSSVIEEGGWQLPQVYEGNWSEEHNGGRCDKRRKSFRLYALKDGLVVWSRKLLNEHCVRFGEQGTIDYETASFYAVWLQGYDPVFVPERHRRPKKCLTFDRAMDTSNTWAGIGSDPDDYRVTVTEAA